MGCAYGKYDDCECDWCEDQWRTRQDLESRVDELLDENRKLREQVTALSKLRNRAKRLHAGG